MIPGQSQAIGGQFSVGAGTVLLWASKYAVPSGEWDTYWTHFTLNLGRDAPKYSEWPGYS